MKTKTRYQGGFSLIELMVVITIIALLAGTAVPVYTTVTTKAKISADVSNCRQIVLACRAFAADWDGLFPSFDPDADTSGGGGGEEDSDFSTSTEAFNVLIPQHLDTENIFWKAGNPEKPRQPREDGELEQDENTYCYVTGQTDTSFSRSPLVADEQESTGTYGENHPWLRAKKAVVGYCGGNVAAEQLTSDQPGATVRTRDGLIDNIFEKKAGGDSEEGGGSGGGGLLSVDPEKVLQP